MEIVTFADNVAVVINIAVAVVTVDAVLAVNIIVYIVFISVAFVEAVSIVSNIANFCLQPQLLISKWILDKCISIA